MNDEAIEHLPGSFNVVPDEVVMVVFLSGLDPSVPNLDIGTTQLEPEALFFLAPPSFQSVFAAIYLRHSRESIEWYVQLRIPEHVKTPNLIKKCIPPVIGELLHRRELKLQNVKGPIPKEIGGLMNVKSFPLEHCLINGPLPEQQLTLMELKYLNLHNCGLTGTLPCEVSTLQKLEHLFFDINALEGNLQNLGTLRN
ncbi:hypothetical protein BCR33DRAFT_794622 [Rhizoclosmatium globosum]|uniref:L domain-like protein n=1 Tax=Rhizoclosmatium globosum TaxID=329046 RepID=A0A1Y2AVN2_9FUNG|nr:hypothetical protein BCR33DRAFT_794622 [Rhizoclosmatium globosum]|eukprot:ORY26360.1 hypothetical protein BCR33DRAFT_794622 [Rhizoclosmatium globosum]